MSSPLCPHCGNAAERVPGAVIYRNRPDLADIWIWSCKPCNSYVGCHPGTDKPLGPLAKSSTRRARVKAHAAFDPIWKRQVAEQGLSKRKARGGAYAWLSAQLGGVQSNIGEMDEDMCGRVIAICHAHTNQGESLIQPLPGDYA